MRDSYATPAVAKAVYVPFVTPPRPLTYVGNVLMAFAIFMPDQDFGGFFKYSGSVFPFGILALVLG